MTDRGYGYFELNLFDGAIKVPLKFCTSYPGEDKLRANAPTKTGVDGRATNRVFVLSKEGHKKIDDIDDIERVIPWGDWETYLNTGTATNPVLEPLSKFDGLAELLEQDKLRSKERDITVHQFHQMSDLKPFKFTGRHFHTYPQTAKIKDSENWHNIYRLLACFMKKHDLFLKVTYFSKGEELGALYADSVNGQTVLRLSGLYADSDLKPVTAILSFPITRGLQKVVYEKFEKLRTENSLDCQLEWRDYVRESLEKTIPKKAPTMRKRKKVQKDDVGNLEKMFEAV